MRRLVRTYVRTGLVPPIHDIQANERVTDKSQPFVTPLVPVDAFGY